MKTIQELERHLSINFSQLDDLEFLETVEDIRGLQKSLDDINANLFEEATKDLGWEGAAPIENEVLAKEILAHSDSVLFAAALREMPVKLEVKALMSQYNVPIHYYCELELEGETFFADAHGIFYRVEDIQRTEEKGTPVVLDFDNDDCPAVRNYRDTEASFLDEMPGDDCGEQVELAEVYYAQLVSKWLTAINESKTQNASLSMVM